MMSNTHHLVIFGLSLRPLIVSDCEKRAFGEWFMDERCFMQPDPRFMTTIWVATGYMLFDLYVQWFLVKAEGQLATQVYFHHAGIITCLLGAHVGGYAHLGICNFSLTAEVSTIFLNLMSLFKKQGQDTLKATSQVIFLILFNLLRILMWPFLTYVALLNMVYCWPEATLAAKIVALLGTSMYVALYLLQVYWY